MHREITLITIGHLCFKLFAVRTIVFRIYYQNMLAVLHYAVIHSGYLLRGIAVKPYAGGMVRAVSIGVFSNIILVILLCREKLGKRF